MKIGLIVLKIGLVVLIIIIMSLLITIKGCGKRELSCMDQITEGCYWKYGATNGYQEYNTCKFDRFYSECSQEDCLRHWGHELVEPEKLTKDQAEMMLAKGLIHEEEILKCYEMGG